jgi:hypothetical protein
MSQLSIPIDAESTTANHDVEWSLVERIAASQSFRKTARLKDLLYYLAEKSICGEYSALSEQHIGQAVLGKSADYSPVEDSSVRVHIRQLRLKLHEYFDCEGREEPLIVEIPKGGYMLSFRAVTAAGPEAPAPELSPPTETQPRELLATPARRRAILPWIFVAALSILCLFLWQRDGIARSGPVPWPLNEVFDNGHRSEIVLSDSTYAIRRFVNGEPVSVESYMRRDFQHKTNPNQSITNQSDAGKGAYLARYSADALLTSWADVSIATTLLRILPNTLGQVSVRSARDLHPRDLEDGNYVFVGSPASNPWVLLFENRLNFRELRCDEIHESAKVFLNKHPRPGEQGTYKGLGGTGLDGSDFASIALLPSDSGRGNILIIQGLQQESTEAAGLLLTDEGGRDKLKKALKIQNEPKSPVYFEALLRVEAVGGSPKSATIVASRILKY